MTIGNMVEGKDFDNTYVVEVIEDVYEKAVIKRIKEMLDFKIKYITKEICFKGTGEEFVKIWVCGAEGEWFAVKADLRPWEDGYTIEVGE